MTFKELLDLGERQKMFTITDEDRGRVRTSFEALLKLLETGPKIYGLHTGYGSNVLNVRKATGWRETQTDLLQYLHVGRGEPLSERIVRRALRLQAMKTAQGVSGIHPETFEELVNLSNADSLPRVPCLGSLGASGDLIPMAHAIAPIFTATGPRGPRDVIGLVNTNSMMASLAIELYAEVRNLIDDAHAVTALNMIAVRASREPLHPRIVALKRDPSYGASAARIASHLDRISYASGDGTSEDRAWLQARYSIRCAPVVLGNSLALLDFAETRIVSEALAVADNPVIAPELESALHAGLFYAAGLATAADQMNDVLGKTVEMLDRQTLLLMDPQLSEGLPVNLEVPGHGHLKGIHQLLSSLGQRMRALSVPSRALSFSCEGNNQDIVPCGMTALNQLRDAVATAQEAVRAAAFSALRGAHLRSGNDSLPASLSLGAWDSFNPRAALTHAIDSQPKFSQQPSSANVA